MSCTHQLARARQQDTCHLCGFDLRGGSDQRIVRLVEPLAGQYCSFEAGELVKVKPSTRAGTTTVERAIWRNSLTISNVLAYVPSHLVCTEPNASDLARKPAPLDAAAGSVKIELRYNGDYPGYACIRINDRWATDKEEAALVTIFGARGIKHLYDIAGAERSHEEHKPWVGTLSFSQNAKAEAPSLSEVDPPAAS